MAIQISGNTVIDNSRNFINAQTVGIGTSQTTSNLQIVNGDAKFGGVVETVATATTYNSGSNMVLEMDVRTSTVYTYTMPTGANIGIVSFKNFPAQTNNPSGLVVSLLVTQNSIGNGNTTPGRGIGTNCTVVGYENGAAVAGISTRGLVGSGLTVTLSATGNDVCFLSFFVSYNGGTNTTPSNYKVYVVDGGNFRRGNIGI